MSNAFQSSLFTGSADASLSVWDLDHPIASRPANRFITPRQSQRLDSQQQTLTHHPIIHLPRRTRFNSHTHTITSLTPLPHTPSATPSIITTSYTPLLTIHHLTPTSLSPSSTHHLPTELKLHLAIPTPHPPHNLLALATASPHIRLLDLRTSSISHTLSGHAATGSGILSLAFSPLHPQILTSGGADGAIRIWDIRRAASCIGLLDKDDPRGMSSHTPTTIAHDGPVNGLAFSPQGNTLISVGWDAKVRVWDPSTGANRLVAFTTGAVRSAGLGRAGIVFAPGDSQGRFIALPSRDEVVILDVSHGQVVKRLRPTIPPPSTSAPTATPPLFTASRSAMNPNPRITAVAWRGARGETGIYSSASNGSVTAWLPQLGHDNEADDDGEATKHGDVRSTSNSTDDDDEDNDNEESNIVGHGPKMESTPSYDSSRKESRKRKKQKDALDDIYRSFMGGQKITFG